eukprot:2511195-Prymnesium_polylepis.1
MDHINSTRAWLVSSVTLLVLDEADRLLDLGFQKDLEAILAALDARATVGSRRQVGSAPPPVQQGCVGRLDRRAHATT